MQALLALNHVRRQRAAQSLRRRVLIHQVRNAARDQLFLLALEAADELFGKEKGDYSFANRITRDNVTGQTNLSEFPYSCEQRYRLDEDDLVYLADHLIPLVPLGPNQFPDLRVSRAKGAYKFNNVEALCLISRKLAYPHTWTDMEAEFGRSAGAICAIFYYAADLILQRHGHLLDFVPARFATSCPVFAQAVAEKGIPQQMHTFAFMDGTKREVCYPCPDPSRIPDGTTQWYLQRALYSGKNKEHCLSYQIIIFPHGIFCMYGPVEGRHADPELLYVLSA